MSILGQQSRPRRPSSRFFWALVVFILALIATHHLSVTIETFTSRVSEPAASTGLAAKMAPWAGGIVGQGPYCSAANRRKNS